MLVMLLMHLQLMLALGADVITVVKLGGVNDVDAAATYTINSGDSILAARDTIDGFDLGAAALFSVYFGF